jgi:hypothetical protein
MPISLFIPRGFATALIPAALGGAVWEATGLPLGWLMGSAAVSGAFAAFDRQAGVPPMLYRPALAVIGVGVGLAVTPAAAAEMLIWAPVMAGAALLGIAAAAAFAPVLARLGNVSRSTAYFSLLPGGVIEMSNVGEAEGADSTVIAALHALRVGLVTGLLPLLLFFFFPAGAFSPAQATGLTAADLFLVLAAGLVGGMFGAKAGLPAAWLLGAVIAVGLLTGSGAVSGRLPDGLLAVAQILAGMSLGARFQRSRLAGIPRALGAGGPVLLAIMAVTIFSAALCSLIMPQPLATLILCFSIGGMAEMVLTAKALDQNIALVAAFQALRGLTVNSLAAPVWRRLALNPTPPGQSKG